MNENAVALVTATGAFAADCYRHMHAGPIFATLMTACGAGALRGQALTACIRSLGLWEPARTAREWRYARKLRREYGHVR